MPPPAAGGGARLGAAGLLISFFCFLKYNNLKSIFGLYLKNQLTTLQLLDVVTKLNFEQHAMLYPQAQHV